MKKLMGELLAASQAVKAGSTPVPCSKKEETHKCVSLLFWSCTFATQKWSPAGG